MSSRRLRTITVAGVFTALLVVPFANAAAAPTARQQAQTLKQIARELAPQFAATDKQFEQVKAEYDSKSTCDGAVDAMPKERTDSLEVLQVDGMFHDALVTLDDYVVLLDQRVGAVNLTDPVFVRYRKDLGSSAKIVSTLLGDASAGYCASVTRWAQGGYPVLYDGKDVEPGAMSAALGLTPERYDAYTKAMKQLSARDSKRSDKLRKAMLKRAKALGAPIKHPKSLI